MADGMVDGHVSNRDRQQVLEHYLEKIAPVYNGLYAAVEHDFPVNLKQLVGRKGPSKSWPDNRMSRSVDKTVFRRQK